MKKLFISQPMRGKTDEEIILEREAAILKATEVLKEEVEILDTFFDDFEPDSPPLFYIAKSIEFLAKADIAYFAPGWQDARGCRIEHQCAISYDVPCIYPYREYIN